MNPTFAAHAAAILTILIWGATFTSTKVLLQAFAPIEILFLRFLLGACALLLACPRLLHVRDRRREVTFALAGLCGVTLYFLLENIALSYSTASNVGVLVGISPFLTALLARIVLGESLHPGFFVGFVCAMSGIVCIAVNSNAVLRLNPLGDVLALLAALTWAFYSILTRKIGDYGYNTLQVTRRIFCWGLLFMLPTLPLSGFRWGLEQGFDYICEMDCDFSHNPDDLVRLYEAAAEGNDVVVGSRYVQGVNVVNWPMSRLLMSYFASMYVRIVTRLPLRDATAGFVCYSRRALETIDLDAIRMKGYGFQIEMKYSAWRLGLKLKEVSIIFVERREGVSKMSGGIFREAFFGVLGLPFRKIRKRR